MNKGKKEFQPINPLWVVIFAVAIAIIVSQVANAQESFQSNDMNTVGGDIGGNDALGIGFSSPSFGAAISQCIATKSENYVFGAFGRQTVIVNYWCMGSSLYQMGKYDAAARVWCQKTDLGDLYPSQGECMKDLSAAPETPIVAPIVEGGIEDSTFMDQHVEIEDALAAEVEVYQMQMVDMRASIDNLENSRQQEAMRKAAVKQEIAEYFNVQN